MSFIRIAVALGIIICSGISLLPHLRFYLPAADSIGHFWIHLVIITFVMTALGLLFRLRSAAIVGTVSVLLATAALLPDLTYGASGESRNAKYARTIRLLQFNVFYYNADTSRVIERIRSSNADLVVLQEVSPAMRNDLMRLQNLYPRQLHCSGQSRLGKVSILTRFPGGTGTCFGSGLAASLPIHIGTEAFTVIGLHLHWPWPHRQKEQMDMLGPYLSDIRTKIIMAGDLNAAPWSQTAGRLAKLTGTRIAGGYRPSWLTDRLSARLRPVTGLAIDHAFADHSLELVDARSLAPAGSDHLPVLYSYRIKQF